MAGTQLGSSHLKARSRKTTQDVREPKAKKDGREPTFEDKVNTWRGWCCLVVMLGSLWLSLSSPRGLCFWLYPEETFEATGQPGFILAFAFALYLLLDMIISLIFRNRFRRSMGAVYLHHICVGLGIAGYLYPSPPRAFFVYVWGEALTVCRLLPPRPRWAARHWVFCFRRATWLYLIVRDTYSINLLWSRWGLAPALIAPTLCVLLLALDAKWWAEHCKSVAFEAAASDGAASTLPADGRSTSEQSLLTEPDLCSEKYGHWLIRRVHSPATGGSLPRTASLNGFW